MNRESLKKDLTILVCSCDAYEDLWMPFFTLLKRYWSPLDIDIILNTESKSFSMDGLDIQCVHSPNEKRYGQRMLNALEHIKTEYVLLLLDDFFLRKPVCEEKIKQIISWLKADENIVYFNCDILEAYVDYEVNKYPGFKRLPPASYYMLNMQPAIWRTDILKGFWRPDASPWEWETMYNLLALDHPQYKYYSAISTENVFLDYGYYKIGDWFGVCRGKWVIEDVKPLFEKENIDIDFSIRGIYNRGEPLARTPRTLSNTLKKCKLFCKVRPVYELPLYIWFEICRLVKAVFKHPSDYTYVEHIIKKERKRFLSSMK